MPKNIVILFVNEGDISLIRKKMRVSTFGSEQQIVKMQLVETAAKPRPRERQNALPRRINGLLNKRSEVESLDGGSIFLSPFVTSSLARATAKIDYDLTAVAGTYRFLEQQYREGDRIILVGVARGLEECNIVKDTILHLARCLDNGTGPSTPSPVPVTKKSSSSLPIGGPYATSLVQRQIPIDNITLIHHSKTADYISYNNELLDRFPTSVNRFVTINYAPGNDVTCSTIRDRGASSGIKSREVWFFDTPIWQGSYIIYSTMGYIHYHPQFTNQWLGIKPINTKNIALTSQSTTLLSAVRCSAAPAYNGNMTRPPSSIASIPVNNIPCDKTSPTSVAASCQWLPIESDTIEPPGMNALEMRSYRAFRRQEEDDHLPRRVLWRVSYSEDGVSS